MSWIPVLVKRVFEVCPEADFEGEVDRYIKYCYNCGSPLMYVEETFDENGFLEEINFYCAVCGKFQGGVDLKKSSKEE